MFKNSNWRVPINEAVSKLYETNPLSLHVPGHKYGQSIASLQKCDELLWNRFQAIMQLDVTELSCTDDLHAPDGAIAEAQKLAAHCYGAEETFFLVGGSTAGNLAMIMACCDPGELLIVQRNVHKSVLNGLALAGARVVFVGSEYDLISGCSTIPSLADLTEACRLYPNARAVLVSNPSYYGFSVDLTPYAELVHSFGMALLVDEAHGAHYGFHPLFPKSALQAGADAVVQSTHKTLTALTMGAMLHIQGNRVEREGIRLALSMLESSSPSYPIMISLDIARAMLQAYGATLFEQGIAAAQRLRLWIANSEAYELVELPRQMNTACDPLRIVIRDRKYGVSGYALLKIMEKHGCWAEMADPNNIVLLIGIQATDGDIARIEQALLAVATELADRGQPQTEMIRRTEAANEPSFGRTRISEPVAFSRRKISDMEIETVDVMKAEGRQAATAVIPYPPGIPILYPGERITSETVRLLSELSKMGAKCQGVSDSTLLTVSVLKAR